LKTKLKIIYTGGTLGMQQSEQGLVPARDLAERFTVALQNAADQADKLDAIQWSLIECQPLLDSANMQTSDWESMAAHCRQHQGYQGVVLVHGTDTLAYTASALAFLLADIQISVIITGAQHPLGTPGSDALDNLSGALLAATLAPNGVQVYFNQRLMPGARVVKKDALSLNGFDTPRYPPPSQPTPPLVELCSQHEQRGWADIKIATVIMQPAYDAAQLAALINTHPGAIILCLYGVGTLPDANRELLLQLQRAHELGIVLVAVSQCYIGEIDFQRYATGRALKNIGVLSARDMTLEAAYSKLAVLFRLGYSVAQIRTLFVTIIANEMSIT